MQELTAELREDLERLTKKSLNIIDIHLDSEDPKIALSAAEKVLCRTIPEKGAQDRGGILVNIDMGKLVDAFEQMKRIGKSE